MTQKRIRNSSYCLIFFLISYSNTLWSQTDQYKFTHLDVNEGLSHNQVNTILKDSRGFIWIGTMIGLNRYDGYTFKVFHNSVLDSTSVTSNFIQDLFEDPHGRLWVGTPELCIFNPETETFHRNIDEILREYNIPPGSVSNIIKDNLGNYWFLHSNNVLYRYDPLTKKTTTLKYELKTSPVNFLAQDKKGNYWLVYQNGQLEYVDGKTSKTLYSNDHLTKLFPDENLRYNLKVDNDDDLWIYVPGSIGGVFYFNTHTKIFTSIRKDSPDMRLNADIVRSLVVADDGLVWVATDHGGINIIDKKNASVKYILHDPDNPKSLIHNSINSLYKDNEGIIWIGTYKKGVNYYHRNIDKFQLFRHHASKPSSLPYDDINWLEEDDNGNLWIGTNGGGLVYFNRATNTFKQYVHDPNDPTSLSSDVIVSLCLDHAGILWIGTFLGGLDSFDGKRFTHYTNTVPGSKSITDNSVWEILEDSNYNLWIGTLKGGVNVFDNKRNRINVLTIEQIFSNYIPALTEDKEGNIWIGTGYGISIVKPGKEGITHLVGDGTSGKLSNSIITSLLEDSRGIMWVGTQDGLNYYNKKNQSFKAFHVEHGLPHNSILHILEDNQGNLWVSTPNGISNLIFDASSSIESLKPVFKNYDEQDGLQGKQFNESAGLKTSRGEIIFAGANGFNIFRPKDIQLNSIKPSVVLTDFQVFNKSVPIGVEVNGNVILEKSITETQEVTLGPRDNVFSIEFAALSFYHPEKNRYKYKLEGFNDEWLSADSKSRRVTYTNLNPGEYTFRVIASNEDGIWNEEGVKLKINVLPPFWKTTWAFILYGVIIVGAMLLSRQLVLERERMKYRVEQERQESHRIHELDMMKIRFFTNVSHEFRTPLTLIMAPLEKLLKTVNNVTEKEQYQLMYRNAKRLLTLVNQLLDFRRMEVQEVKLNASEGDIIKFIKEVTFSFSDLSEKKSIHFEFHTEIQELETFFDQDKLEKILFNLLSNAFKFTPERGSVHVKLKLIQDDNKWLEIRVIDTGIGIPEEKHEKIFERFFQHDLPSSMVNQGSGIGLSITKEFVRIHGGTVRVESQPNKGSCFIVMLPVREIRSEVIAQPGALEKINFPDEEVVHNTVELLPQGRKKKPVILLVEDNEDFRFYLKDNLTLQYQIVESKNGKEAWHQAQHTLPDLIVSDVMMPEMNGIEFCKKIKNDPRTSHIPVILLTARTAEEQRLEGYESGADDYVTKPFNFEILLSRIKNLVASRAALHKTFHQKIDVKASEVAITSLDEKLIKNAITLVEVKLADADFSVEDMSKELGMSRVHLYKKLLALTGKTPLEFIRTIRLQRAAQLLEKSQLTVAEVAYKVGFNNPKYFAKYFKEEFNVLPSQYTKRAGN